MPITLDQVTEEAMQLPADHRAMLAERMYDSLETDEDENVSRLWTQEALRRRDEMRSGAVQPIPLAETLEKARRLVGR